MSLGVMNVVLSWSSRFRLSGDTLNRNWGSIIGCYQPCCSRLDRCEEEGKDLSGGETWIDPQRGYPSGCRLTNGGSEPKRVGGSSRMELGNPGVTRKTRWFVGPPKSKTLRPIWLWYYVERDLPSRRESTMWTCPWWAHQAALYWLACLGLHVGFHLS
jgi:hypothetical protein